MFVSEGGGRHRQALGAAFVLTLLASGVAWAEEAAPAAIDLKAECVVKHEQAQHLRRTGKLMAARGALAFCSQEGCPGPVKSDCLAWTTEVNAVIPTLVLSASSPKGPETKVSVYLDGKLLRNELTSEELELEPGVHVLRFELSPYEPVERELLVVEGQRGRTLNVDFKAPEPRAAPAPVATPALAPSPSLEKAPEAERPVPTLSYVFGGAALVGLAGFIGFGVSGMNEKNSLEASCAPLCDDSELEGVRTKFILADTSLGIALVSAALGAYTYFTRPELEKEAMARPSQKLALSVIGSRGRGHGRALVQLEGAF